MPRPLDAAGDESAQLLDAITVRLGETQQLVTAAARRLGRLEAAAEGPAAEGRDQAAVLIGGVVGWLRQRSDAISDPDNRADWQLQINALARAAQLLALPISEV